MKKVLSVLLAAAMVMGMSVSAMAANFSKPATGSGAEKCVEDYEIVDVFQVRNGAIKEYATADHLEVKDLLMLEGDTLYFPIYGEDGLLKDKFGAPANWTLKIKDADYIEDAYFTTVGNVKNSNGVKILNNGNNMTDDVVLVAVELSSDFNAKAEQELGNVTEFYLYIWDGEHKGCEVYVHYGFEKYETITLYEKDQYRVIPAKANAYYVLDKDLNSGMFVFGLNGDTYVTAKMWKDDKYMITSAVNAKWSKELSKQYDTDIELLTIESNMDVREVLFESAKDNKQVVEFVDGELVAVDAEYVTKYEVIDGYVLAKGYIADAEENGTYALISADIELIEVEEEATEEETKENPSTGANDFVGAAVALAVVSVAAAGALALKK